MPSDHPAEELDARLARAQELIDKLEKQAVKLREEIRGINEQLQHGGVHRRVEGQKSPFLRIAEVLMDKGNKPRTANPIMKATGISRSALSQILHRTHKDSFVSIPIPGYSRKKLWALTEEARAAVQLGNVGQETLFGTVGDFSGVKAVDCCFRILQERGNEPMNALTMAREAIGRGYRGKARGSEDEVLLTTAKSFWAALSRDQRFEEVRALVFKVKEPTPPLKPPGAT